MPQQSSKNSFYAGAAILSDTGGAILILAAISIFILLAVVGLSIDSGNLYRARLALQNAADAAAVGTVGYINMYGIMQFEEDNNVRTGTDAQKKAALEPLLEKKATALVRTSLARTPYAHVPNSANDKVEVWGYYYPGTEGINGNLAAGQGRSLFEFKVKVQRKIDFLIMDLLPFIGLKDATLKVEARSQRTVANVSLILDLSKSMACPKNNVALCQCLEPDRGAIACPGAPSRKFDVLIEGVKDFLKYFDLDEDRIAFIPFNIGAGLNLPQETLNMLNNPDDNALTLDIIDRLGPIYGINRPITVAKVNQVTAMIGGLLRPRAGTNLCDGLMEGWGALDTVAGGENHAHVIFSDGAPTAGRFLFTNNAAKPAKLDPITIGGGMGPYDYTHYSVQWVLNQTQWAGCPEKYYAGPSLLIDNGLVTLEEGLGGGLANLLAPPLGTERCHYETEAPPVTQAPAVDECNDPANSSTAQAATEVFSPCLNSLEAHMPGEPGTTYGAGYTGNSFADWREQYYNCAVELSDFMRQPPRRGTLYVIGLGTVNPSYAPGTTDPYQGIEDSFHRKDIFLSRVALDPAYLRSANYEDANGDLIEFDYDEYINQATEKTFDVWASRGRKYNGKYLPTDNADEVPHLFVAIARKILTKLNN